MTTGDMMLYIGIGMVAAGIILFIVSTVIFSKQKKKLIRRIYGENE